MIRTIHRARFVLAEPDLLLQNAAVHVSDPGRISRVEPWTGVPSSLQVEVIDWGSALIMPGLVNAHTHLELTHLHRQLTDSISFTGWIEQLVAKRRAWTPEQWMESSREGLRQSLASGTTLVGDISASGFSAIALKQEPLRKALFSEILAFPPEKAGEALAGLQSRLEGVQEDRLMTAGISPHAPYSVSSELFREVAALAAERGIPLAIHVAETKEELEFLQSGEGSFKELLLRAGAYHPGWIPPKAHPVLFLESLGVLQHSALLIHCNYLDDDSKAAILRTRSHVVFCPRSHAFFGHSPHPVRELLDIGVNVALGTDSLASNDSLSVLDEMRFLFKNRKDLKTEEIFRMSSLNGATALGFGNSLGRLRRGSWADMTVLRIPEELGPRNLTAQVLEGAGEILSTLVGGAIVWRQG